MHSFHADDSIETVIERYMKMVFCIALTHTCNQADAEDVFQEVFLIYHRKNPKFNEEEHRKAWLIRTAVNCSKQITGSTYRKKSVPIDTASFVFDTDEQNFVYDALCELPLIYRITLHLFYFEDLTIKEIGKTVRATPGTVKMRLSRGRALMREKLKGDYFYE